MDRHSPAQQHRDVVEQHFDAVAEKRDRWVSLNSYYYLDIERFCRSVVPPGSRVLEVGCGNGDLLAALQPSRGVGIDFSRKMVALAAQRHPKLTFFRMEAESLNLDETFDYVLLAGVTGYLTDVQRVLTQLQSVCGPHSRLVVTFHNYLWEPALRVAEAIGQRMPQPAQNWLSGGDISNLLHLAGYRPVKHGRRFLLPREIPMLSEAVNRFISQIPPLDRLCLIEYFIARPDTGRVHANTASQASCSVVVPARNERGNIEPLMRRMPRMGGRTEVIFVEGHSSDDTFEEIERIAAQYRNDWDIKVAKQAGKGKADAVRQGFALATGDVLMILDADLTVPPEDLPKFFDVLVSGRGEFGNGSRLVYPLSSEAMPLFNTLANKIFGVAFSYLLGQRFKDTLCGTKVLWRSDYEKIVAGRAFFGDFDPFGDFDLLFGASKLNIDIVEVPVRYQEREYGRSNIQHIRSGILLLKMCLYASRKMKFV